MWRLLSVVFVAALGACSLDEPSTAGELSLVATNSEVMSVLPGDVGADAATAPAGSDALNLYLELAARLDERGVTIEQLQSAVEAGDEDAVREMFGFSDEELEASLARLLAVADGTAGVAPEVPSCDGTWAPCFAAAAWGARAFAATGWLAIAIYTVSAGACAWQACDWRLP